MSIIPVYLSSFSSVAPQYRGMFELAEIDGIDRRSSTDKFGVAEFDKAQNTANERIEAPKRSPGALVVRSGDSVSSYGDVLSLSKNEKQEEKSTQAPQSKGNMSKELTLEEKQQVNELKQRDTEVKAHEAAHLGVAGGLASGGASYEYQKGPDGRNYAVGGEVSIDSSPVNGDPKATIAKAQQIRRAALAPANPSSQDHKVVAKASQMEAEARQELSKNEQKPQDSNTARDSHSQVFENEEKTRDNSQSQLVTNIAVTKYAAQSYTTPFVKQSVFRT